MTNPTILYGILERKQVATLVVESEGSYEEEEEFKKAYTGIEKKGYGCTISLGDKAYFSAYFFEEESKTVFEEESKTGNLEDLARESGIEIIVKRGLVLPEGELLKGEPIQFSLLKGAIEHHKGNPTRNFVED